MTAHSIRILSKLKMSSFRPYAGGRRALHQLRYQLHSVEGHHVKCPTVPQRRELVIGTRTAEKGSK